MIGRKLETNCRGTLRGLLVTRERLRTEGKALIPEIQDKEE
jgi:hypothetical protein